MRRFFIPEAIQTSAMDCGPASLKALLEGFGIHASYGRLREACQTDVDGASIDSVEDAARSLGLDASQVMLPLDHVFAHGVDSLPAVMVVRQPTGATHFVVAWRKVGPWVQLMDPGVGRRWSTVKALLADMYIHTQPVPAEAWREWAGGDAFLKPLGWRIRELGALPDPLIATALLDAGAKTLARLDAAVRMTDSLMRAGALGRGGEASRFLAKLAGGRQEIADEYWSAVLKADDLKMVGMRGAVMIQVRGRGERAQVEKLTPELAAALSEKPENPVMELVGALVRDGVGTPLAVLGALPLAAAGVVVEAVLLRGFFDLAREFATVGQRAAALGALLGFSFGLLLLEFGLMRAILRTGRRLELRMRLRFLAKIPRLTDRYFQSRPVSDMASRCHNVHQLRQGAELGAAFLRSVCGMACTVAAIGWLYPDSLWAAVAVAAIALGIPLIAQPALAERDLRVRSHSGALTQYYLDALLGLTAIRAHGAARAVRRQQVALLGEWASAGMRLQKAAVSIEGVQFGLSLAAAAWLVWTRLSHGADVGGMLLLVYWVLSLPVMGEDAAAVVRQYPLQRNTALRLLEPLGAPEELVEAGEDCGAGAVHVRLSGVTVRAAGNAILEEVSLDVPAGAHVAVVGASGAGKSSLVGLLLGWHRPVAGSVTVDGRVLHAAELARLRPRTAWVDPQIQLWNASLLDNLRYGTGDASMAISEVLDAAELRGVLRKLPEGLQTTLGEGGAMVSGGEGQRVRLGRAMLRGGVRLAILDEPARGLGRGLRRAVMERARERWKDATLFYITHDVGDTLGFERVVVIEGGRIVEDGAPKVLAGGDSRYRALLEAEDDVRRGLWASVKWRRVKLAGGKLSEERSRDRQGAVGV